MARIRKRKITSKLIENFSQRKMCYKKRVKGLYTKMEQMTILCDLKACAVVFGPADTTPSMWPSREVAENLIHKFESIPEYARSKNVTDELSFLKEKSRRLQGTLVKIKEGNEDTLTGSYLYQIENEGKLLSDFEPSVLNRLINFMLKKYKLISQIVDDFKEDLSPLNNPPPPPLPLMSCPLDNNNEANYEINPNRQSLNQRPLFDLVNQTDRMISDFYNHDRSSMGPLPHENFNNGGTMLFQREIFGGLDNMVGRNIEIPPSVNLNGGGRGDMLAYQSNMGVPPLESLSGGNNMFLTQDFENIGNVIRHENHIFGDNVMIPQGNPKGLVNNNIGISTYTNPSVGGGETLFPCANFGDFHNNIDGTMGIKSYASPSVRVGRVFPQGKFKGLNDGSSLRLFNEGNFEGFNGGSSSRVFNEGKFEGFNSGSSLRVFNERKYGGLDVENSSSSREFPPNMFEGLNEKNYQSNLFPQGDLNGLYGIPTNDGSGMTMSMPFNINEENNNGRHMGTFNANFAYNNYGNSFNNNNFNNRFL